MDMDGSEESGRLLNMALTFDELRRKNVARCESRKGFNHNLDAWSTSDWMVALVGEVGEAANIIKKLNRHRDGIALEEDPSYSFLRAELIDELGDIQIYLDLLAASSQIDLEVATWTKFNIVSDRIGSDIKL